MISRLTAGIALATGFLFILLFNILFVQPFQDSLVFFFGWLLLVLFFHQPRWGLFLIIFLRPSIDKFSENLVISLNENIKFNAAAAFGLLVIILTAIFIFHNRKYLKEIPLKKSWLVFFLIAGASVFFSIEWTASVYELVRILSIILIFFSFFILARRENSPRVILYPLIFSSIIPFLFATYQLVTHTGLGGTSGIESRLFGTFSHPNPFASFIVIVLSASIFLLFQEKEKIRRYLLAFLTLWGMFLLIETFSRGAWAAFLLFLFVLVLIKSPKMIFALLGLSFLLFVSSETIRYRVEDVYNPPADSSVRWRFAQWERMYQVFLKAPATGQGIGTETIAHEMEYGFNAGNQYTHNDFLRVALETGVPGVLSYALIIFLAIYVLVSNYRNARNTSEKDFQLFVLALFLAMVSFSLTNNTLRETVTQWTLWALIGTSLAVSRKILKE